MMLHLVAAHGMVPTVHPETRYLASQSCRVPRMRLKDKGGIFKAVRERQEEMWLYFTMAHGDFRPVEKG